MKESTLPKLSYVPPFLDVAEIKIEQGFAQTNTSGSTEGLGQNEGGW